MNVQRFIYFHKKVLRRPAISVPVPTCSNRYDKSWVFYHCHVGLICILIHQAVIPLVYTVK